MRAPRGTQRGMTLVEMGALIEFQNPREEGGEPVADLRVRFSPDMTGIEVPPVCIMTTMPAFLAQAIIGAFTKFQDFHHAYRICGRLRWHDDVAFNGFARRIFGCGCIVQQVLNRLFACPLFSV